jgi:hypothetical protein
MARGFKSVAAASIAALAMVSVDVIVILQNGGSVLLASAPSTGSTARQAAELLSNISGLTKRTFFNR